jgi:MFS family permease
VLVHAQAGGGRVAGVTDRRMLPPLATLIATGIANHIVLTGMRVVVSLDALARGTSAATVGTLMALFAILPMLLAISAGRMADRTGVRAPMLVGSCGVAVAAALPVLVPGLTVLFVTAALTGVSFMVYQVSAQYATGESGPPHERGRNFSLLALGYSTSSIAGPLVAGLIIDHGGYRPAYAVFALAPLLAIGMIASRRLPLPGPHPAHAAAASGTAFELLRNPVLRRVFVMNGLISMAWDLHTLFMPIYGNSIGLSASQIGVILASFASATFLVRLAMPLIMRRVSEHQVLSAAVFVAALVYLAFPFCRSVGMLMSLSFCLGFGIGAGQPMVLALLHHYAPPGRMGEATGVRMSLVNSVSVAVPLLFGAVGGAVGLAPVLWSVGVFFATGCYFTRRADARD